MVLYALVGLVITGIIPYDRLNVPDPIAVGVDHIGLGFFAPIVKLGAILGLSSVILVLLLGQSRIFYSIARDGLLHRWRPACIRNFERPISRRSRPASSSPFSLGLAPIGLVGELVSIGTLFAFVVVCIGVMILRYKHPNIERPFRTPAVNIVGPLGAAVALLLMIGLPLDTWIRLAVWLVIGLAIYFLYGRKHSHLDKGV